MGEERLHPEGSWRLVHHDDAPWVKGAEEEVVEALQHGGDGGGVVLIVKLSYTAEACPGSDAYDNSEPRINRLDETYRK